MYIKIFIYRKERKIVSMCLLIYGNSYNILCQGLSIKGSNIENANESMFSC